MKIRNGFVSNSSSSSFLIIGVEHSSIINKIYEKDKPVEGGFGISNAKVVNFYGGYYDEDTKTPNYEYVGIDIVKLLEEHTIPQIKKIFLEKVKKELNIEIPENAVKLFFGEASSE